MKLLYISCNLDSDKSGVSVATKVQYKMVNTILQSDNCVLYKVKPQKKNILKKIVIRHFDLFLNQV
jgi:hypothetical protein